MKIGKVKKQRGFEYICFEAHSVAVLGSKTLENGQRVVVFKLGTKKWLSLNFPENYHRNPSIIALSIYIRYKTARLL